MPRNTKTSFRIYTAWNYEKEIEDLNAASERGWQLKKGGCFHSRFVRNPDVRYRYQLDYRKIEDMGRYIDTFREQGWEYINSTFNGWHYFRKLYDPALPEESYEIFTDRQSLSEMNGRWARLALAFCIVLGIFAVFYAVMMILQPQLPSLVMLVTLLIECAFLIRGIHIMRRPESGRNRRGDSALFAVFFAVIILGVTSNTVLHAMRPNFRTEQQAGSVEQPVVDNRWNEFTVEYPDCYYLDLTLEGTQPVTFAILDENEEKVFERTETKFEEKDIRIRLSRGNYTLSMSAESGFHVTFAIS